MGSAHRGGHRRRRRAAQALAGHAVAAVASLAALALALCLALCLSPAHRLCDALRNLLLLGHANLAQVYALGDQLLQHLAHQLLVNVLRVELGCAEQRPQARLVLDCPRRHGGAARRLPLVSTRARLSAPVAAPLPPPALPRQPQAGTAPACYASLAQTQLLHLLEHPAFGLVTLVPAPQLGQHIVAGRELGAVCLLLLRALAPLRVRLEEYLQQCRHRRIGLRRPHRRATRRARVRVDGGRSRRLEGEPLLQAGAAEGVQAVEQRERLEQDIGTDLRMAE